MLVSATAAATTGLQQGVGPDACEVTLKAKDAVENVRAFTVVKIDEERFAETPWPMPKLAIEKIILEDNHLAGLLTMGQVSELAEQLTSFGNREKVVQDIIGEYLVALQQKPSGDGVVLDPLIDEPGVATPPNIVDSNRPIGQTEVTESAMKARAQVRTKVSAYLGENWSHFSAVQRDAILSFLETSIFPDPLFLREPRIYLRKLQRHRGGLQMLITPNDQAQSFLETLGDSRQLENFADLVWRAEYNVLSEKGLLSRVWTNEISRSNLKKDIQDNIKLYLAMEWGHLSEKQQSDVVNFLEIAILPDPQFQSAPEQYLFRLIRNRGGAEMLRIPNDIAQAFLVALHRNSGLLEFAESAPDAGYKVTNPSDLLSARWTF